MSAVFRVVLDTNVLRAALWSSKGASFRLVSLLPIPNVTVLLSVPLYFEYQEVLTGAENLPPDVSVARMQGFLRRFAARAEPREIYFLWRPWLRDGDDDMVLELAVSGAATHLVTFNTRDFEGVESAFGIRVVTPAQFLASLPTQP